MSSELRDLLTTQREPDPLDERVRLTELDVAVFIHNLTAKKELERGNGTCRGCRQPIPEKRLAAVPGALRCTPCQENWEKENLQ